MQILIVASTTFSSKVPDLARLIKNYNSREAHDLFTGKFLGLYLTLLTAKIKLPKFESLTNAHERAQNDCTSQLDGVLRTRFLGVGASGLHRLGLLFGLLLFHFVRSSGLFRSRLSSGFNEPGTDQLQFGTRDRVESLRPKVSMDSRVGTFKRGKTDYMSEPVVLLDQIVGVCKEEEKVVEAPVIWLAVSVTIARAPDKVAVSREPTRP
jgi:hypothetical protein